MTKPSRRLRRVTLAQFLALAIGGLVFLAVGAVLVVELLAARRIVVRMVNEVAVRAVAEVEQTLRNHLEPVEAMIEELAALILDGRLDPDDPQAVARVLTGALASRGDLTSVVLVTPDYQQILATRAPGPITILTTDASDDPLIVEGTREAAAREGHFWGEVVVPQGLGRPIINLRRAVRAEGGLVAFLAIAITVDSLSHQLDPSRDRGAGVDLRIRGTPFVVYGGDRVLAHPYLASPHPEQRSSSPLVQLDRVGDPALARLHDGQPLWGFETAAAAGVQSRWVQYGDADAVVFARDTTRFGVEVWTVGVWLPADVLLDYVEPLQEAALVGVALLALAVLVAVLVGRMISAPLREVTQQTAKVSELDLAAVPPLPPSRIRELDEQASAFNRMLETLRAFETYVPRTLVQRLIRLPGAAIASRERDLTVMFTDIAGFTRISEKLPAAELAALLNGHFALLAEAIEAEGGTIDKYLGDGVMAFWGAPEKVKERARRACRAALAIRAAVTAANLQSRARGAVPLKVRIGIHRGRLVVGNIGAPGRLNYTVVGDTTNVAQRLEDAGRAVAADTDVAIIVSDAVVAEAGPGFAFTPIGPVEVKGRLQPIRAYRLDGDSGPGTAHMVMPPSAM